MIETVQEQAESLAKRVADCDSTFQLPIAGGVGVGKTTLLLHIGDRLAKKGVVPVLVSPPSEALDAGPAAMVQAVAALRKVEGVSDRFSRLTNANVRWADKLAVLREWLAPQSERVVLLCDEPDRWPISADADASRASYNNSHTMDMQRWATMEAPCRRIVTKTWIDDHADKKNAHFVNWRDLRFVDLELGPLTPLAEDLEDRTGTGTSRANFLAMKLLVALAAVSSVEDTRSRQAEWPLANQIARSFMDALETNPEWHAVGKLVCKIALVRKTFGHSLLERLGANHLEDRHRNVLLFGILQS